MPANALSEHEREEIRTGITLKESFVVIAKRLHRNPSTVSREVARNGSRHRYKAFKAQQRADQRRQRPRSLKLVQNKQLSRLVTADLKKGYSPAGIAARLRAAGGDTVSHETIYRTLYSKPTLVSRYVPTTA